MDIYAILTLSPTGAFSSSSTIFASFSAGTDSPVKADSSIWRLAVSINLKSAGMYLPASIITISPVTTSSDGISINSPFLFTNALGVLSCFRASRAFSAFDSCTTPIVALIKITIRIIIESLISPIIPEITAAAIKI